MLNQFELARSPQELQSQSLGFNQPDMEENIVNINRDSTTKTMDAAKTCLNIAIDHRIRELFGPVTLPVANSIPSAQPEAQGLCSIANYIDTLRKLDTNEVDVTQRLAGQYGVTRRITVLLKQPRDSHAFDRGMAATVSDCGTLQALHDMFSSGNVPYRWYL